MRYHGQDGDVSLAGLGQAHSPVDCHIVGLLPADDQEYVMERPARLVGYQNGGGHLLGGFEICRAREQPLNQGLVWLPEDDQIIAMCRFDQIVERSIFSLGCCPKVS